MGEFIPLFFKICAKKGYGLLWENFDKFIPDFLVLFWILEIYLDVVGCGNYKEI